MANTQMAIDPRPARVGLQTLPAELIDNINHRLDAVYDVVHLHKALRGTLAYAHFNFTELALKHADNLLQSPALCSQIRYKDNQSVQWDKMCIRPSSWTGLRQDKTYLQMIRGQNEFRRVDCKANPTTSYDLLTREQVKAFYEKEQAHRRWTYLFQSRGSRSNQGYPSARSRKELGLANTDMRNYTLLIDQTPFSSRQSQIHKCMLRDGNDEQQAAGQEQAFRRFFHNLVDSKETHPAACIGCLASNFAVHFGEQSLTCLGIDPRLCIKCLPDWANSKKPILYSSNILPNLHISVPARCEDECAFLNGNWFPGDREIFYYFPASSVDRLCQLYHGSTYDTLRSASLPQYRLAANARTYRFAAKVAERVRALHASNNSAWSKLEVDVQPFDFWRRVIDRTKGWLAANPIEGDLDRMHPIFPIFERLAVHSLTMILRFDFDRILLKDAQSQFQIVKINELDVPRSGPRSAMDDFSIAVADLRSLCCRMHGMELTEWSKRPIEQRQMLLTGYLFDIAPMIRIMNALPDVFLDVIIDLVTVLRGPIYWTTLESREERLRVFFDFCLSLNRIHMPTHPPIVQSMAEVPEDYTTTVCNAFWLELIQGNFLKDAHGWAASRRVTVQMPLSRAALEDIFPVPAFFQGWVDRCGVNVISEEDELPFHALSLGCLYWSDPGLLNLTF